MQCVSLQFAYLRELTYKWCASFLDFLDCWIIRFLDFFDFEKMEMLVFTGIRKGLWGVSGLILGGAKFSRNT